ncbi:MAG: hypothetical protein IPM29_30480 [Planctomycetes bacterium]|nr:hypothetical protein [Planctomycetota bacterium]
MTLPASTGLGALLGAVLLAVTAPAQVILVEPGHQLRLHMDSMAPLHPSQRQLEIVQPIGDIESVCVDQQTGDVYVQLIFPPMSPVSQTTHIFRVSTKAGDVVTPVALNTGFGICERGADLQLDPNRNMLVTQDQNTLMPERLGFVALPMGVIGTWSWVTTPPIFQGATFGMDFSNGNGGSVVPPGDIVFTADVAATGIHTCRFAGPGSVTLVPAAAMPGGGDDMVNQPDGDWIWVGDFNLPIVQILPFPPFPQMPSALNLQTMFNNAGLAYIAGSRAAVCDVTGVLYVSFSGATGGTGIFRVDERLMTSTLMLTIGNNQGNMGLHDLEVGPSTLGTCNSLWFTVHDYLTGGEQLWEVTIPSCCPIPSLALPIPDPRGLNVPRSIMAWPLGNQPFLGNAGFAVQLDDPALACPITPGSPTFLLIGFAPFSFLLPGFGCLPGTPGDVMMAPPLFVASGPLPWPGPVGAPPVHPLGIPFDAALCGLPAFAQGLWVDPLGPSRPALLSWRLDLVLGF